MIIQCLILSFVFAHQIPFVLPKKRILVIGAGAGGSSFVYSLRNDPRLDVTVYEQSSSIGGRAKVTEFGNLTIELGASILSVNNFLLNNASIEFGLERADSPPSGKYQFGIWNGREWYWRHDGSWINNLKFLYKYGIRNGPLQAKKVVSEFANQFFQIYSQLNAGKVWDNLGQEIESLGLTDAAKMSCKEFYQSKGISELYIDQVMGSILRNIYLSNVDHVHSVGCSVALYAASFDTFSIKGGNYKLFERMLQGHTVHLDAKVKQITNLDNSIRVEAIVGGKSMISDFDDVVLAAPLQHSGIELVGFKNNHWSQKVDYLKLYVTIAMGQLDAGYFQSDSELEIPTGIFTPADSSSPFHCLSIHKYLNSTHTISKIFSNHELSDNELLKFYVSVENVKRHEWNHPGSYPDLIPRQDWNYTVNDGHLWYLNGFEPFISTMETSGLSAMNVAKHLTSN